MRTPTSPRLIPDSRSIIRVKIRQADLPPPLEAKWRLFSECQWRNSESRTSRSYVASKNRRYKQTEQVMHVAVCPNRYLIQFLNLGYHRLSRRLPRRQSQSSLTNCHYRVLRLPTAWDEIMLLFVPKGGPESWIYNLHWDHTRHSGCPNMSFHATRSLGHGHLISLLLWHPVCFRTGLHLCLLMWHVNS